MKIGIGNWARPFASVWRVVVFTLVVCATGQAWAAVSKPLAVWNGDFVDGNKRGPITFNRNNHTIAADKSKITIGTGTNKGGALFQSDTGYSKIGAVITLANVVTSANGVSGLMGIKSMDQNCRVWTGIKTSAYNLGTWKNGGSGNKGPDNYPLLPSDKSRNYLGMISEHDSNNNDGTGTSVYLNKTKVISGAYTYKTDKTNSRLDGVAAGGYWGNNSNSWVAPGATVDYVAIFNASDEDTVKYWSLTDMTTVSTDINTTTTTDGVNLPASATLTASATPAAVFVQQTSMLTVTGSGSLNINSGNGPLYVADGTTLTIDATGITSLTAQNPSVTLVSAKIYGTDLITVKVPVIAGAKVVASVTENGITLYSGDTVSITSPFDGSTLSEPTGANGYGASSTSVSFGNTEAFQQMIGGHAAIVVDVFGGTFTDINGFMKQGETTSNTNKDVYLVVSGATARRINGVQEAHWSGNTRRTRTEGNAIVQIEDGATIDYVYGAGYKGGRMPTTVDGTDDSGASAQVQGNTGVTVKGGTVNGSIIGGWSCAHNGTPTVTGNTAVRVEKVLGTATATAEDGNIVGGYVVGGSVYQANSASGSLVGGNSSVTLALTGKSGTFNRTVIGGSAQFAGTTSGNHNVTGNSSVTITAANDVAFPNQIVGGGAKLVSSGSGVVNVGGNSSVTISGGTYTGRIVAGGYAPNGGTANVSGTATLTLNSGVFTGATLDGGNATGAKALVVGDNLDITGATVTGFTSVTLGDGATAQMATGEEGSTTLGEGATLRLIISDADIVNGYTPSISGSGTVKYYEYVNSVLTEVTDPDRLDGNSLIASAPQWSPAAADGSGNLSDAECWSTGSVPADNAPGAEIVVNGANTLRIDADRTFGLLKVTGDGSLVIEGGGAHNLAVGNLVVASSVTVEVKDSFSITTSIAVNSGVLVLNPTEEVVSDEWTASDDGTLVVYVDSGNTTTISIPITATKLIKRGAGTLDLTAISPSIPMVIDAGKVVADDTPTGKVTINENGTFELKDCAWTSNVFSGSGTLYLHQTNTATDRYDHSVSGSSFSGRLKIGTPSGKTAYFNEDPETQLTGRPELVLELGTQGEQGQLWVGGRAKDKYFRVKNLSGWGYVVPWSNAQGVHYFETVQNDNTEFSGSFKDWNGSDVGSGNYKTGLTVKGNSVLKSLTLAAANDTTGPLEIQNNGKVIFSGSGSWLNGTTTVKSGGVLESQRDANVASNLVLEAGSVLAYGNSSETIKASGALTPPASGKVTVDVSDLTIGAGDSTTLLTVGSGMPVDVNKFALDSATHMLSISGQTLSLVPIAATLTSNGVTTPYATVDQAVAFLANPLLPGDSYVTLVHGTPSDLSYTDEMLTADNIVYNSANGRYVLAEEAKIDAVLYPTIEAAIAAAGENDVVELARNVARAEVAVNSEIKFSEGAYTFSGSFTGSGTLALTALLKSAHQDRWAAGWTGTVVLPTGTLTSPLNFNLYGISESVVQITGAVSGYLPDAEIVTTVKIPSSASLTLTSFSPSFVNTFDKIVGEGALSVSVAANTANDLGNAANWRAGYNYSAYLLIKDVSKFTGSLTANQAAGIAIGAKPHKNTVGGKIIVSSGKTATVGASSTWTAGTIIEVNGNVSVASGGALSGTIAGSGEISLAALVNSAMSLGNWTGTVVLPAIESDAIIFNNYGKTGSTVRLTSMSSLAWIQVNNTTINPKLYLEGDMTLSSMSKTTYTFAEIDGPGDLSFASSADSQPTAINITKVAEGYSGTISSTLTTPVTIGKRNLSTLPACDDKVLAVGGTGTIRLDVSNIKIGVNEESLPAKYKVERRPEGEEGDGFYVYYNGTIFSVW